jgi:hypothetical protein
MICYCERLGNILRIWGKFWEPHENTLGTQKKKQKMHSFPTPPPKKQKKKKSLLIGCMNFLFSKWFVTIFNLD